MAASLIGSLAILPAATGSRARDQTTVARWTAINCSHAKTLFLWETQYAGTSSNHNGIAAQAQRALNPGAVSAAAGAIVAWARTGVADGNAWLSAVQAAGAPPLSAAPGNAAGRALQANVLADIRLQIFRMNRMLSDAQAAPTSSVSGFQNWFNSTFSYGQDVSAALGGATGSAVLGHMGQSALRNVMAANPDYLYIKHKE